MCPAINPNKTYFVLSTDDYRVYHMAKYLALLDWIVLAYLSDKIIIDFSASILGFINGQ